LDLSTQQIQKYERGTNRISASTLYDAAKFLDAPIGFFFEGYEDPPGERSTNVMAGDD
jgi:transcriptional regulator with XRE-family HTH domain